MYLEKYLKSEKLTYGEFARKIGVSRNAVYFWATNKRRPNVSNTFKIEDATNKFVTAKDLVKRDE